MRAKSIETFMCLGNIHGNMCFVATEHLYTSHVLCCSTMMGKRVGDRGAKGVGNALGKGGKEWGDEDGSAFFVRL